MLPGSLLAKSCKSALLLGGHTDQETLQVVYSLGRETGLAWQGYLELAPFSDTPSHNLGLDSSSIFASILSNTDITPTSTPDTLQDDNANKTNVRSYGVDCSTRTEGSSVADYSNAAAHLITSSKQRSGLPKIDLSSLPVIAHVQHLKQVDHQALSSFFATVEKLAADEGDIDSVRIYLLLVIIY